MPEKSHLLLWKLLGFFKILCRETVSSCITVMGLENVCEFLDTSHSKWKNLSPLP